MRKFRGLKLVYVLYDLFVVFIIREYGECSLIVVVYGWWYGFFGLELFFWRLYLVFLFNSLFWIMCVYVRICFCRFCNLWIVMNDDRRESMLLLEYLMGEVVMVRCNKYKWFYGVIYKMFVYGVWIWIFDVEFFVNVLIVLLLIYIIKLFVNFEL